MKILLLLAMLPSALTASALFFRGKPPAPPEPLEGEWKKAVDPSSGRIYYWNTATRESRWTPPSNANAVKSPSPALGEATAPVSDTAAKRAPDDDAAAEEEQAEEQYAAGEADFEEYTASNPSRPLHRRLKWMGQQFADKVATRALQSREERAEDSSRPALRKGLYLGTLLVGFALL